MFDLRTLKATLPLADGTVNKLLNGVKKDVFV